MRTPRPALLLLLLSIASGCPAGEAKPSGKGPAPAVAASSAGMCAQHGVPEALCTKCNPALAVVFKNKGDWCEEHGFPESYCPSCNPSPTFPDVAPASAAASDWCVEDGLPESKCTKCNPALVDQFKQAGDWCEEHGFPESVCPVCRPQTPPAGAEKAAIEERVVRFLTADIEAAAGIRTVEARRAEASPAVTCTARIEFDGDRVADIRAIVPGIVRRVRVGLGDRVKKGEPLFELESTQVGEAQGALMKARGRVRTAKANLARQRELRAGDIASDRQVEAAEQELSAAEGEERAAAATVRMAGAASASPTGRFALLSPMAGTVVRRPAVVGALASESESLATVADTSVMWALCDVPEGDAPRVARGQRMRVTIDGLEGEPLEGEVTWIASEVDARTRTVSARAELSNAAGQLRANQFARARIETGVPRSAVSVPRAALQRVGEQEVVFVRTEAGVYQPRVVRREGGGDPIQVEGEVHAGDAVVTTGAVLLRTEILPGSIGAGCCRIEPREGG